MGGGFSAGGLISGIDSNSLIKQLIALERQPIQRVHQRIALLETQRDSIRELRTELLSLRNLFKDFQLGLKFNEFSTISGDESVLKAETGGSTPVTGTFNVDILQLATATVASGSSRLGAAINPGATLNAAGTTTAVTAGTFTINGVQFTVDPAADTLTGVLNTINASGAGVTATYDAVTDTVSLENDTPGDTSFINVGATGDTSDFLEVTRLARATQVTGGSGSTVVTSSTNLGAVNPGSTLSSVNFDVGAVTAGNFFINGTSITIDPSTDSLSDVLARINGSDAGVNAVYDPTSDTVRVVADTLGSRTISFTSGTSNFLDVTSLTSATQTAGSDSQFTLNGGAVQTRNTNDVTGVIPGVTLLFESVGTSSLTIEVDDDAIGETIQEFVDTFNESLAAIQERIGSKGAFENDASLRSIRSFLTTNIFQQVPGIGSGLESLLDIGISTGSGFDPDAPFSIELDAEKLREAVLNDREGVQSLFTNAAETGIVDLMFDYLDETTKTSGFLNDRARSNGSIDLQIDGLNDRIDAMERRVAQKEARLRRQFLRLETVSGSLQTQGASLAGLSGGFSGF